VHATPTKPGRPAAGLDYVAHAAATVTKPWFAIGGLDAGNVGAVVEHGASRIVVVRAITEADDPARAARALRAALEAPVRA
jgi:thiamine-phosphate pyrophosphorylase